jgi:hypothetical protein
MRRRVAISIAILMAVVSLRLLGQQQVNPMVNNRVNGELYGGGTSGSVRYAGVNPEIRARTSMPTQSEFRYAYYATGATPSSVRMGYNAMGPMAEGGPISYLSYKPDYLGQNKPAPPPPSGAAAYPTMGSVRLSSPAPASGAGTISAQKLDALVPPAKPVSPPPSAASNASLSTSNYGSVRYAP